MATRREGREWAVQLLFQLDLNPSNVGDALAEFWESHEGERESRAFTEQIVKGVRENLERLDRALREYAENWAIERMGVVERNVLRMALYEMHFRHDIPPVVSINEAVDLTKYFGNAESGRFINGILDRAQRDLSRPARSPAIGPDAPGNQRDKGKG